MTKSIKRIVGKITLSKLVKKYANHVKDVQEYVGFKYSKEFKADCVKFAKQERGNAAKATRALNLSSEYISDWKCDYHAKKRERDLKAKKEAEKEQKKKEKAAKKRKAERAKAKESKSAEKQAA